MSGKEESGKVSAELGQGRVTGETPAQTSVPVTAGEGGSFQEAFAQINNDTFVIKLLFVWNAVEYTAKESIKKAPTFIYTYTRKSLDLLYNLLKDLDVSLYMQSSEFNKYNVSRQAYVGNIEEYKKAIESMITVDDIRVGEVVSHYRMHPGLPFFDEKLSLLLRYLDEIEPTQKGSVNNPEEEAGVSESCLSFFHNDGTLGENSSDLKSGVNELAQIIVMREIARTPTAITLSVLEMESVPRGNAELKELVAHYKNLIAETRAKYIKSCPLNDFSYDYPAGIAALMKEAWVDDDEALINQALGGVFIGSNAPMKAMPGISRTLNSKYYGAIDGAIKKVKENRRGHKTPNSASAIVSAVANL